MMHFPIFAVNWSNIQGNWSEWITTGYTNILNIWVVPLIIAGIIGYIYAVSHSATAAAVSICLAFGIFGITGVFAASPEFGFLSWFIVVTSFAGGFVAIFTGRKR